MTGVSLLIPRLFANLCHPDAAAQSSPLTDARQLVPRCEIAGLRALQQTERPPH